MEAENQIRQNHIEKTPGYVTPLKSSSYPKMEQTFPQFQSNIMAIMDEELPNNDINSSQKSQDQGWMPKLS